MADRHRARRVLGPPVDQARDHRRLDRRARRVHLRRLAQLGQGRAQVEHREHLQDGPGVGRQHPQVLADGGGQRPGQRNPSRGSGIEAGPFAQHRLQVQRVAPGAAVQPPHGLLIQRPGRERGRQRRDLIRAQPAQRYEQPVLYAPQQSLRRLVQLVGGPAVDHHGGHRVDRQPPQHERQRLHRPAVGPLQVIDHDGHGPGGLLLSDDFQQPRAHGERRGGRSALARGHHRPGRIAARPEQLIDEPELQVGLGLVAPRGQHLQAGNLGQALPRQGRFPHARVALDGHQPRLPRRHPGQDVRDLREFRLSADENLERYPPVLHAPPSLPSAPSATGTTTSLTVVPPLPQSQSQPRPRPQPQPRPRPQPQPRAPTPAPARASATAPAPAPTQVPAPAPRSAASRMPARDAN